MHPSYEIPPPIGYTPGNPPIPPPIGGVPSQTPLPPVGGVDACPMIEAPISAALEAVVPSYPLTPAIGSYAGINPGHPIAPPIGAASPLSIVPQVPLTPQIGGPSQQHGYLATEE